MSFTIKDIDISEELINKARFSLDNKKFICRFDSILGALYTRYMLSRYQPENRLYPILGALGLAGFLFADQLVIPELLNEVLIIRASGALLILFFLGLTYYQALIRWHQLLLCMGGLAIHLSLIFIGILAAQHGQYHYQFGSIITIFFLSNVLRVGFLYALPFTLLMLAAQLLSIVLFTEASQAQVTEIFFIYSFVSFISLIVNGRMEHEVRKNFLRKILLKYEQERLNETQEELRKQSISDTLTGLFNRRYFNTYIEREWLNAARQKKPLAVLMIDVDDFKRYNDTLGHLAGDDALAKIGQALKSGIKRPNDVVARYGGEEFVVILPDTDIHAAYKIAEDIAEKVRTLNISHLTSTTHKKITISTGCCSFIPDQESSIKILLKCADDALYDSKHKGKNCTSTGMCCSKQTISN